MTNRIISQGYIGVNMIITQGYEISAVSGGDSARYYYMKPKPRRKVKRELLLTIKNLLLTLKGE